MRVIYADSVFLLNFLANGAVLLCTKKICACGTGLLRMLLSAAFGGIYAVLSMLDELVFLNSAVIKLSVGAAMAVIAFGGEKLLLRKILVMFSVAASFGGIVFASAELFGKSFIGGVYIPTPVKTTVLLLILSYLTVSVVFRKMARGKGAGGIRELTVKLRNKSVSLKALHDTGNSLTDVFSGGQVIVAELPSIRELFSPEEYAELGKLKNSSPAEVMCGISSDVRFRLVPYKAVGTDYGLLLGFRPDEVQVNGKKAGKSIIAITVQTVSDGGAYSALTGGEIA